MRRQTRTPVEERPAWLLQEGGGDWTDADRRRYRRIERATTIAIPIGVVLMFGGALAEPHLWGSIALPAGIATVAGASAARARLPYTPSWFDYGEYDPDAGIAREQTAAERAVLPVLWLVLATLSLIQGHLFVVALYVALAVLGAWRAVRTHRQQHQRR